MLTALEQHPPMRQAELDQPCYDSWVAPDGDVTAEFRRTASGFHIRFPDQADFAISADMAKVRSYPAPGQDPQIVDTLYHNAIVPLIGNYLGDLHLHGSAVAMAAGAVAFLGQSRRGKTTIAGACARQGHPFLTEDVLCLVPDGPHFSVIPQRPVLRLFSDSAAWLNGAGEGDGAPAGDDTKQSVEAGAMLPCATTAHPLGAIFLLGPGESAEIEITPLPQSAALTHLFPHAFVLDVENRAKLAAHFDRLATLAGQVPCHLLDYPRSYGQLPSVVEAVASFVAKGG